MNSVPRFSYKIRVTVTLLVIFACGITGAPVTAAPPAAVKVPQALLLQVQRLTELLRDSYAEGYPNATMVQNVKLGKDKDLTLVVFTIEGYGGGNSYSQILAAFSPERDNKGTQHFRLLDFLPIGGKGWREVSNLHARVRHNAKRGETAVTIDALGVSGNDAPNFPSKKITIKLMLRNERLFEL